MRQTKNKYLTRNDILMMYYSDISRYDVMTDTEEKEAFSELVKLKERLSSLEEQKSVTSDLNAITGEINEVTKQIKNLEDFIIASNLRFVVSVARQFATNDNQLDVIEEGSVGLMEAMKTFKPELGNKFITYAVDYIKRNIHHFRINDKNMVRQTNKPKTYFIKSKIVDKFFQKEKRMPTDQEVFELINEEYGVKIKNSIDLIDTTISSLSSSKSDAEEDGKTFEDSVEFVNVSASENQCIRESETEYNKELATELMKCLKPIEKKVIEMSFGIGYEPSTNQTIGELLGFTTERIRQIRLEAIDKMKKAYEKYSYAYV